MNIKPNVQKALFLAKRELPMLVCNAVNLEGINYTLPEVQTLLDGITVGGHKVSDENITLNQAKAWEYLFRLIEENRFEVNKPTVCELHGIAAKAEALTWGEFRSGGVTITGTDYMPPTADHLDQCWDTLLADSEHIKDIYDRAIYIFLQMARCQFFYDVNKRMGRFIMNGLLLSQGYLAINLPAKRQLEFNQLMLAFYDSNDAGPMTAFMKSCLDEQSLQIMNE